MSAITHVDRYNSGTLRRYHVVGGMVLVCVTKKSPKILPTWCRHIHKTISRTEAAALLRSWKSMKEAA